MIRVADGDTITVLVAGKPAQVRLAGIDAPEMGQAFGQQSKQELAEALAGRNVLVETHKQDRYGRHVGRVLVDGHDAGVAQLEKGLAWHFKAYEAEQPVADRRAYAAAEQRARLERRGLWADPMPQPPWEWRKLKTPLRSAAP